MIDYHRYTMTSMHEAVFEQNRMKQKKNSGWYDIAKCNKTVEKKAKWQDERATQELTMEWPEVRSAKPSKHWSPMKLSFESPSGR